MSKFTDSIKAFITKHFTQEVTCCNCGKKGKTMFFSTLQDGKKLCSDCKCEIPDQFSFKPKETTFEEYKKLFDYIQHSKNNLKPIFNPSDEYSYGKFKVDPTNMLCSVCGSFVFEIKDIDSYLFNFKAEDVKEGVFSTKVKGDVYLASLILKDPLAIFESQIIKANAKGKAEKKFLSNTVLYDNPDEMDEFVAKLDALCEKINSEKAEKELQELVEKRARELVAQQEGKVNE